MDIKHISSNQESARGTTHKASDQSSNDADVIENFEKVLDGSETGDKIEVQSKSFFDPLGILPDPRDILPGPTDLLPNPLGFLDPSKVGVGVVDPVKSLGNAALLEGNYQAVIDYVDQNPATKEADQNTLNTYKEAALLGIELDAAAAKGDYGKVGTILESLSDKFEEVSPEMSSHYSAGADLAHQANTIITATLLGDYPQAVSAANTFSAAMESEQGQWGEVFDPAIVLADKAVAISDSVNSGNLEHASKIASDYAEAIPDSHPLKEVFTAIAENIKDESTGFLSDLEEATNNLSLNSQLLLDSADEPTQKLKNFKEATDNVAAAAADLSDDPSEHNINAFIAAVSDLKSSVYSLDEEIDADVFDRVTSFVDGLENAVSQAMNENSEGGINGQIAIATENVEGLDNLIKDVLSTIAVNDA